MLFTNGCRLIVLIEHNWNLFERNTSQKLVIIKCGLLIIQLVSFSGLKQKQEQVLFFQMMHTILEIHNRLS